jgi:hypothetical protein
MALQSSVMDQQDASTLSHVVSSDRWRYWILMMEMAHVFET